MSFDIVVFLAQMNVLFPAIKLTLETESNSALPFLDVELVR